MQVTVFSPVGQAGCTHLLLRCLAYERTQLVKYPGYATGGPAVGEPFKTLCKQILNIAHG